MWVPSAKLISTYGFMLRMCNILFGICMFVLPWILVSAFNPPGKGRYISVLTAMLAGTLLAIINTWNPRHFFSTIENQLSK